MRMPLLLGMLLLFCLPGGALWAQDGAAASRETEKYQLPKSAAEARRLAQGLAERLKELRGDDTRKELKAVIEQQKAELEALATLLEEQPRIADVARTLQQKVEERRAELSRVQSRKPRTDFSRSELKAGAKDRVAEEIQKLTGELNRARADVESAKAAVKALGERLKVSVSEVQKAPLAEVAKTKAAAEEARSGGDPVKAVLLREQQYLAELKLERIGLNYNVASQRSKAGVLELQLAQKELERDILKRRLELAGEEQKAINEKSLELAREENARKSTSIAFLKRRLQSLSEEDAWERGRLELQLLLRETEKKATTFLEEESRFRTKLDARAQFVAVEGDVEQLADLIKNAEESPDEEVLPTAADELRELRDEAKKRYRLARMAMADINERLPQVTQALADAAWDRSDLSRRVREAEKASAAQGHPFDGQLLQKNLEDALSHLEKELTRTLNDLRSSRKEWERIKGRSHANLRYLNERLLWTRDDSDISVASLKKALEDLSDSSVQVTTLISDAARDAVAFLTAKENRLRSVIALVFILVAGLFFYRLHLALPRTYGWLDAQAHEGRNAPLVLGIILRRTDVSFMILAIFVGAPLIAGFDGDTVKITACIFAVPFFYRLGRVLLDVFMLPGRDEERIFNLDEELAVTLHRAGRWLLNLALVFVPAGLLIEMSGYHARNPGVAELWWLIYESLSHLILLFSVFRPAVVGSIIRGGGIVAISVKTWILILYPFVVGGTIFLYVLGSLRYLEAESFFQALFLKTLVILLLCYLSYRLLLRAAIKGRPLGKDPNPDEFDKDSDYVEVARRLFFDRLTRLLLQVLFFVPAGFLIFASWADLELSFLHVGLFGPETASLADIMKASITLYVTTVIVRMIRQALAFVILPRTDLDRGLRYTISMLVTYGLWTVGLVVTLNIIKIRGEHIAVFTGALAFGIGFGLQSIVKNFVSGLILLIERPVKVGDKIDVGNRGGTVEKITLRATTVMTWEGTGIVIPNETMVGGILTNHSLGHPRLRSTLAVGVAYGCDTRRVREILTETVKSHGLTLKRPAPEAYFVGFGDSSLDFQVRYWTSLNTNRPRVMSDLRFALEEAFRRENIEIPFPQQDLHIRSVDGEVLGNMGSGTPGPADEKEASSEPSDEPVSDELKSTPKKKTKKAGKRQKGG